MSRIRKTFSRGMTLIEVMLGLAILAILVGGVMAIVDSTLTSTGIATAIFRRTQNTAALTDYFRRVFFTLPPAVRFQATVANDDARRQTVIFDNAPGMLSWGRGRDGPPDTRVSFYTKAGANGGLDLFARKEFPERAKVTNPPPVALSAGLKSCRWEFYNAQTKRWQDNWDDVTVRPKAVRLRFQLADAPDETLAVLSLSPVLSQR
jgi:prepilin-type N-terminal cleavage/methylation domain-containing protein